METKINQHSHSSEDSSIRTIPSDGKQHNQTTPRLPWRHLQLHQHKHKHHIPAPAPVETMMQPQAMFEDALGPELRLRGDRTSTPPQSK